MTHLTSYDLDRYQEKVFAQAVWELGVTIHHELQQDPGPAKRARLERARGAIYELEDLLAENQVDPEDRLW